jgi:hypothetical protein
MLSRWFQAYRIWGRRRLRRKAERYRKMVAAFTASRQPQSEVEFFAACLPEAPEEWLHWSVAVRWAIARLGRVHPRFVHSDDRFSDLMVLPSWCDRGDAFFDAVGLIMLIEEALDISFREEEVERLPNVDSYDDLPVRRFVREAVELCAGKAADHDSR